MSDHDLETNNTPNAADADTGATPAPAVPKKPNKWLTAAFNIASGAAVSLAMKTTVLACTASFLAPAVSIGVAAVAAGVASGYARHYFENRALVKAGQEPVKFTFKKAAFSGALGLAGAGLAAAGTEALGRFAPDFMSGLKNFFGFSAPLCAPETLSTVEPEAAGPVLDLIPAPETVDTAPVVEDVVDEVTAEEDCPPCEPAPSAIDCVTELAKEEGVSARVHDAISRAGSDNPRISAQGVKDLGYFLFNGFDGLPKDPCLAVQLLKEAAENGNIQAKVDLAYLEYHGNAAAGITADPDAALAKMKELGTAKARWFVEQWTGTAPESASLETLSSAPAASTPQATLPVSEAATGVEGASGPVGETIQSGPGMDCQSVIQGGDVHFICSLPDNDASFNVGDKVMIQRPALLHLVR